VRIDARALPAIALTLAAARAAAQPIVPGRASPSAGSHGRAELRLDGFVGAASGAQVGVGVSLDAGTYVRLAIVGGAGAERRPGGAVEGSQRVEGVVRFHVDPFRQARRGWYVAGGVSAQHVAGEPVRPLLVALVGVEGAAHHGVASALEAGVGGGARVGLVLRRSRAGRR